MAAGSYGPAGGAVAHGAYDGCVVDPASSCVAVAQPFGASPGQASGSQAFLLQLTTNLVHNAVVHNLPERGTV